MFGAHNTRLRETTENSEKNNRNFRPRFLNNSAFSVREKGRLRLRVTRPNDKKRIFYNRRLGFFFCIAPKHTHDTLFVFDGPCFETKLIRKKRIDCLFINERASKSTNSNTATIRLGVEHENRFFFYGRFGPFGNSSNQFTGRRLITR